MGGPSRGGVHAAAAAVAFSALTNSSRAAASEPMTPKACIRASVEAQERRAAGKWSAAKDALALCSDSACPAMIRHDCAQWMAEITAATPTVVLGAVDGAGADLTDFRVFIDNTEMTSRVSGQAIPVDPGAHAVRYERPGSVTVERQFVVREGEKARSLVVTLAPAPPASPIPGRPAPLPAASESSGPFWTNTTVGWTLAGVGVVAASVGAFFLYEDVTHSNILDTECQNNQCPPGSANRDRVPAQVTTVNAERALTGVSFTLAAAAFGTMTYVLVAQPLHPHGATAAWLLSSLEVASLPRGGSAGLRFAF